MFLGPRHDLSAGERYRRERTVLDACARYADGGWRPVPRLLGVDVERLWLLQEDLGAGPEPTEWSRSLLIGLAGALAALHAHTHIDHRVGDIRLPQWRSPHSGDALVEDLRRCGATPPLARDLVDGLGSFAVEGVGSNECCHSDLVLGNLQWGPAGTRLMDFEFAADADPACDLAAVHLGLPTAAEPVQFPDSDLRAFDEHYRWASERPPTTYRDSLAAAGAWWLLLVLSAHLPGLDVADRGWGGLSVRRRVVARLALFARLAAGWPLAATAAALADELAQHWHVASALPYPGDAC